MTDISKDEYIALTKKAWIIYILLTIVVVAVLVLLVASDNEEMFFFGIMPSAAAYVLRPSSKVMSNLIKKFTGISPPADEK